MQVSGTIKKHTHLDVFIVNHSLQFTSRNNYALYSMLETCIVRLGHNVHSACSVTHNTMLLGLSNSRYVGLHSSQKHTAFSVNECSMKS